MIVSMKLALRIFSPPSSSHLCHALSLKPGKLPVESIQVVLEELRKKGGFTSPDSSFSLPVGFS